MTTAATHDSFVARFDFGFYSGVRVNSQTPYQWPVALDGHGYAIDLPPTPNAKFSHDSIPVLKPYFLTEGDINERTLNPEGGWRRSQEQWQKGGGQDNLDLTTSDRALFHTSKGIDPWTDWAFSMLPDTMLARGTGNSNLFAVSAGSYLYTSDGTEVYWTLDGSAFTSAVINIGAGPHAVASMDSDGFNVYAALGAGGLNVTTRGALVSTVQTTQACTKVGYVNGRLLIANGQSLWNVTGISTQTLLLAHPNPDWTWTAFCEGSTCIYAAGTSGDKSLIYRIGIDPNGVALLVPIIAGFIPDGETVTSLGFYDGTVIIGTTLGVRVAQADSTGNLVVGAYIPTTGQVRCSVGFGRFVYFGWENFDAVSTGLGRLDLSVLNGSTPAYASDLMATAQGNVIAVCNWNGARAFTVAGVGLFTASPNKAKTAVLTTGQITYDIPDPKVALFVQLRHDDPLSGSYQVSMSADHGPFVPLATRSEDGSSVVIECNEIHASTFELQVTLNRGDDPTTGPVIHKITLVALPATQSGETYTVTLRLWQRVVDVADNPQSLDVVAELAFLKALRVSKNVFVYQEGVAAYTVTMDDYQWLPEQLIADGSGFEGQFIAQLKSLDAPAAS